MNSIPNYLNVQLVNVTQKIETRCCHCKQFTTVPMRISPCNHLLCDDCQRTFYDKCPQCNKIIVTVDKDQDLINQFENFICLCDCGKDFQFYAFLEHIQSCQQANIACPNGCNQNIKNAEKRQHLEQSCPLRMVSCEFCGTVIQWSKLESHHHTCPKLKMTCNCGEVFNRTEFHIHIESCPSIMHECPLCSKLITNAEKAQHFSDSQFMMSHFLGVVDKMQMMFNQQQFIVQQVMTRLATLENNVSSLINNRPITPQHLTFGNTTPRSANKSHSQSKALEEFTQLEIESHTEKVVNQKIVPQINMNFANDVRTSLRVIPNVQTVGAQRVSTSLMIPDELFTHNQYEVNMAPPVDSAYLEVISNDTFEKLTFKPVISGRQIYFLVTIQNTGQYTFKLLVDNGGQIDCLDEEIHEVFIQSFIKDETIVGCVDVCLDAVLAHTWLCGEPLRVFMKQSTLASYQCFKFRVTKCNAFVAFGVADSDDRNISKLIIYSNKKIIQKDKKKVTQKEWDGFQPGDEVSVKIKDEIFEINVGEKSYMEQFEVGSHFFIEVADGEVLII